ncbi:hypothetical protein AgCh_011906 [Apium graveolens]
MVTNQSLRKIIHNPDVSGRLVNWAVELSQFNLSFIPTTAIKAQELADFIIECNFPEEEPEPMNMDPETEKDAIPGAWALKVDGSSTSERSGAGLILKRLKLSRTLRVQDLKIYSDSQIVVEQTNGEYIAKDPILAKYQALVQSYLASIPKHQVIQIFQEENEEADILSKLVWNSSDLDCSFYFEELHKPSIDFGEVLEMESNQNWMTPFINYLDKGELPEDKGKSQRLKAKAAKFFLEEGLLYRRTFSSPILKYVGPEEAKYCLSEVHEGICRDHMPGKALAHKIIRQGYYWPTIHQDAIEFMKKYKECQLFSNVSRIRPVLPSSVLSPIPFAVWVSDNGPQFIKSEFESYLQERGIKHKKSSVAYPQGNGQVQVTNRILLRGIEKRLKENKNKWPEELPSVLWSYKTSPKTSTRETPFKLAYGTEAMLPIEVGFPSHRAINFDEEANEEGLRTNMELIDEVRDQAVERMERYKEKTREHFRKKSRVKNFQVGDLVLRDTEASYPTNTIKLMPKWEGPYKVKEVLRPGTNKLLNMDGSKVPNTWHGLGLRKFYQ